MWVRAHWWLLIVALAVGGTAYGAARYATDCLCLRPGAQACCPLQQVLELTPAQQAQVADLQRDYAARRDALMAQMEPSRRELVSLLAQAEPDRAQLEAEISQLAALQAQLQWELVEHLLQVRSLLDEPQRQRLQQVVGEAVSPGCDPASCFGPPGPNSHDRPATAGIPDEARR